MRRLLIGITVPWVGLAFASDGVTSVLLPVLGDEAARGQSVATVVGLTSFAGLAIGALLQPYAGVLSDHRRDSKGRRDQIAFGTGLTILALVGLGSIGSSSLPVLLLLFIGLSAATAFTQAAVQAWIPDRVSRECRGRAAGWKTFADVGGAAVAFLCIGQAVAHGTGLAAGLTATAVVLTAALGLILVRNQGDQMPASLVPERGMSYHRSPLRAVARDVFRVDVGHRAWFLRLVTARFCFLLGVFAIGRFLVLAVAQRFHLSLDQAAGRASVVLGVLALVSVLASPAAGSLADRFGRRPLMVAGALIAVTACAGSLLAHSLWLLTAWGVVLAVGNAGFTVANWAMITDIVPSGEAARHMALANLGTAGAAAAAGLLGPAVDLANRAAAGWGYTMLFLAAGLAMLVSALILTRKTAQSVAEIRPSSRRGIGQVAAGDGE